jgi:gamma-glutamylcyclotransferase
MSRVTYFAYGSNMSSARLKERVPSAKCVGIGYIAKHKLTFDKVSEDQSAKCDAEVTGSDDDSVHGVLFDFDAADKDDLDRAEGLGFGYEERDIVVNVSGGGQKHAVIYCATKKDSSLMPYHWYKNYALIGAREHDLPEEYIVHIESVTSKDDPDLARREYHTSKQLSGGCDENEV